MFEHVSDVSAKLEKKLREYWDDDGYVRGVFSFADHEDDRKELLRFIESGDEVTTTTISLYALDLNIQRHGEQ